ncbi:hypothetical protein N658DRAFT_501985 [Parathielavia hyrcaniae]|uniref:Uncharacterized protein n=1 Tax=Parathielavia hyrcaniae TaxID=113614 RepID=A0AAN6PVE6_9PEZI|nr:hypothetical protein N658DRAFT_501985 [Parathielavia hyrcaniae]
MVGATQQARPQQAPAQQAPAQQAQIIKAPTRPAIKFKTSLFLAGTTSRTAGPDWRPALTQALGALPVTIFNPLRPDWDSTWREEVTFAPFREQVEWELHMQEQASFIVVYFGPSTEAPISLLELGLCARSRKVLVVCHAGYKKRGNVQIVCRRFGIQCMDAGENWMPVVVAKVKGLLR